MAFKFKKHESVDILVIETDKYRDDRGFFTEFYKSSAFKEMGIHNFPQINVSTSNKNVIRGLHYQRGIKAQGKLVRVLKGKVLDAVVDMRPDSPKYKQWATIELSDENGVSVYVPPGFAHGFSVLSDEAVFLYACTEEYDPTSEGGIRYDDPTLNIDWKVSDPIVSDKDKNLPYLK